MHRPILTLSKTYRNVSFETEARYVSIPKFLIEKNLIQ